MKSLLLTAFTVFALPANALDSLTSSDIETELKLLELEQQIDEENRNDPFGLQKLKTALTPFDVNNLEVTQDELNALGYTEKSLSESDTALMLLEKELEAEENKETEELENLLKSYVTVDPADSQESAQTGLYHYLSNKAAYLWSFLPSWQSPKA